MGDFTGLTRCFFFGCLFDGLDPERLVGVGSSGVCGEELGSRDLVLVPTFELGAGVGESTTTDGELALLVLVERLTLGEMF